MKELTTTEEVDALLKEPITIVFKHSTRCPISTAANDEIAALNTSIPVYRVLVIEHRDVSNYIEELTKVRHESPQVFVVKDGTVTWHASHRSITKDAILQASS